MAFSGIVGAVVMQDRLSPVRAVELAFKNRDLVASARLNVESARKTRRALGAYPAIRLESGVASNPDVNPGEDLSLFVPLDVFGRTRTALRQGSADVRASEVALRQTLIDVQSEALQAYVALASAQRIERVGEQTLELSKEILRATIALVEARRVPEVQRIRADLEVKRQAQVVVDRKAATLAALTRFRGAIGLRTEPLHAVALGELQDSMAGEVDVSRFRPDLAALRADMDRATADASAARQSRFPSLEAQFRRAPWSSGEQQYGFRLSLTAPLWDDGQSLATARAAQIRKTSIERALADRTQVALRERDACRAEYEAAKKSVQAYRELVAESETVLGKVRRGFELGAATLLDVIDARRALSETLELSVAAEQRVDLAIEALLRVQGHLLVEVKP